MDANRLLAEDSSFQNLLNVWGAQCEEAGDCIEDYAGSSIEALRKFAESPTPDEWAVSFDKDGAPMAVACASRVAQKGFVGKVLRIREVTVCPNLDYGILPESDYIDTLIGILNAAINLSETSLRAIHIKMHLRSPADSVFFRAVGNVLDSKDVFAEVTTHGAWLTFTKKPPIKLAGR